MDEIEAEGIKENGIGEGEYEQDWEHLLTAPTQELPRFPKHLHDAKGYSLFHTHGNGINLPFQMLNIPGLRIYTRFAFAMINSTCCAYSA